MLKLTRMDLYTSQKDDICFSSETVWMTEALSDVLKLPDKIPGKDMKMSRKIEKSLPVFQKGVSHVAHCQHKRKKNEIKFPTSSLVAFRLDLIQCRPNRCINITCLHSCFSRTPLKHPMNF